MFVSPKLVAQYQQAHQRKYGEAVTKKEAEKSLSDLSELVRQIKTRRRVRHGE